MSVVVSYSSPSCFLMWALLSCSLGTFLLYHLYSFDRFRCLRWNDGPYSGAFKRVMTYSYFFTIPLFMIYAVGFAVIKYREGYVKLPIVGKLCFWLFLINAQADQTDWFKSHYFKVWVAGSVTAVLYMPIIAICTRENPLRSEAVIFLAGSLGSLIPTILFMPILWKLPKLMDNLRAEGADDGTIIKLTKFHELNIIRVFFRYLFTVPLLILGIDGLCPSPRITGSAFWTDMFAFIAAIGCTASSGITLLIFFPRSIENEISMQNSSNTWKADLYGSDPSATSELSISKPSALGYSSKQHVMTMPMANSQSPSITQPPVMRPNRRLEDDIELGGIGTSPPEYDGSGSGARTVQHNRNRRSANELGGTSQNNHLHYVNPIIYSYTSPISCVLHLLIVV
ncbi:hypothetical protein F5878DRAFT_653196 [Lentinula raphanica]|uniref:Uncharacterized protein n=1 Tax=Lentinula raphanica TaxID=153919 RepID=A0AA38UC61_9AGAR|nr:hypothetical protein F5878DRAFT_653196 [Lentinula raphanica]